MVGLGTLVALLLFVLGWLNIQWAGEHFGLNIAGTVAGAPTGYMSLVTAFCFLLAGVSFLASLSPSAIRPWRAALAQVSASVLLGSCLVCLLAYGFGTPLLYDGQFIPPALNTILAFITLGLALLAFGRPAGPFRGWSGDNSKPALIFALIFLLLAMGIVGTGYAYYRNIEGKFRAQSEQQLSAIAELKVGELVLWRKERFGDAQTLSGNPVVSQLVRRWLAPTPDVEARRQLQVWLAKYLVNQRYDEVFLLDAQGRVRLSASEAPVTVSAAIAARLPEALGSAQPLFQDFYRHEKGQQVYFSLLVPIRDETYSDRTVGVLVLRVNPELYLYPFIQRWPIPSLSAEALLVRRDGNEALYLNNLRHQANAALVVRVPLTHVDVPSVRAILGETGPVSGPDYRDEPVVASALAVPDSPWFLIAKIDRAEVYAPLRTQFWQTIAFIGALLFGAGAAVGFVWRQQRVRFYRNRIGAAEILRASEERYRTMFDSMQEGFCLIEVLFDEQDQPNDYRFLEINPVFEAQTGLLNAHGKRMRELAPQHEAYWFDFYGKVAVTGEPAAFENEAKELHRWFTVNACRVGGPDSRKVGVVFSNITERKLAEAEKEKLTAQLIQAQKMESVGRLAAGVAHDFNNMLTVINGYSDFLLDRLSAPDLLRSYAQEIRTAGERAASLTRQLLAFGRKQIIHPTELDLNGTIRDALPMLQRLIGENIKVTSHLDGAAGVVIADPDQLNQVIMNLLVNARDAMPGGGRLDIGTANVELDEEGVVAIDPAATPGRYVLITVADTGCGMNDATRQQIFEPFFTTKEAGKGTGLGLSTVYGIIRQSNGWITVKSEVGVGTSFRIYLPRIDACLPPEVKRITAPSEKGSGTILIVEDQAAVRSFARAVLNKNGYHVIEASNGEEGVVLAREHPGQIHLLLTDVVLPGMNGKVLSDSLKGLLPHLKVLFISGYPAEAIAHRGVLNPGVAFLQKPFRPDDLTAKVREVLMKELN